MGYLSAFGERYGTQTDRALEWLRSQRHASGGWGRTLRDRPRIPITGLLAVLVPAAVDADSLRWVTQEWEADLAGQAALTYKGAFFLIAQSLPQAPQAEALVERTVAFLIGEQQDDGGFGPWKGHPIGSDPWSTGVVLWGLSQFADRVPKSVFRSAAVWLERTQLPDGNWPYHYLDEGTSLALIGLSSILPLLKD